MQTQDSRSSQVMALFTAARNPFMSMQGYDMGVMDGFPSRPKEATIWGDGEERLHSQQG